VHVLPQLEGIFSYKECCHFVCTYVRVCACSQNVFIDLGEYQTLLRPSTVAADVADHPSAAGTAAANHETAAHSRRSSTDDTNYTLPQSLSYGDDTLRAIAVITEKFDSFRRRQERVRSFLYSRSTSSSVRSKDTRESSVNSRHDGNVMSRLAADHGFVVPPPPMSGSGEVIAEGQVTTAETERARLFYSSVSTQVEVCQSLADVFLGAYATSAAGKTKQNSSSGRSDSTAACTGWVHVVTGIPTLVLSTGACSGQRRELALIVADRQTGFPVWQDRISYMSDYHQVEPGVHTMRVSGGLTKRVRFDIFNGMAADDFLTSYQTMTSDPADELWKLSADDENRSRGKNRQRRHGNAKRSKRGKRLTTIDISQPCDPRWITRIDPSDSNFRSAFVDYLPHVSSNDTAAALPVNADGQTTDAEDFRPRLPTN
jgi:hypothetical protein